MKDAATYIVFQTAAKARTHGLACTKSSYNKLEQWLRQVEKLTLKYIKNWVISRFVLCENSFLFKVIHCHWHEYKSKKHIPGTFYVSLL